MFVLGILIEIIVFVLYWAIKLWWLWLGVLCACVILGSSGDGYNGFNFGGYKPESLEKEMWDWETFHDDP